MNALVWEEGSEKKHCRRHCMGDVIAVCSLDQQYKRALSKGSAWRPSTKDQEAIGTAMIKTCSMGTSQMDSQIPTQRYQQKSPLHNVEERNYYSTVP